MSDASAVIFSLLQQGEARSLLDEQLVVVPHLVDLEVTTALRRRVMNGRMTPSEGRELLATWMGFGCERETVTGLLPRIWELRDNVTPYDAAYVALAEALACDLLTADLRLAQATGPRCDFAVVRD